MTAPPSRAPAHEARRVRGDGLPRPPTRPHPLDKLLAAAVVAALFFQRVEFELWDARIIPVPDVVFVVAVLGMFARFAFLTRLRGVTRLGPLERGVVGLVLLLGAISVAGVVVGPAPAWALENVGRTWLHLAFLGGAAVLVGRFLARELVWFAILVYFSLAVAASGLAIVQAVDQNLLHTGVSEALRLTSRASGTFLRPVSVFSEPAYLGYMAIIGALMGGALWSRRRTWLWPAGALVCVLALFLAASAGPIAVAPIVALYLLALGFVPRRRALPAVAAGFAAVLVVVLASPVGATLRDRGRDIVTANDASALLRAELNRGSVEIWQMAPYTGVGLGNTRLFLNDLVDVPFMPDAVFLYPEASAYFGFLGEVGPLGVVAFVAMLVLACWPLRVDRDLDRITSAVVLTIGASFFFIGGVIAPPLWFWIGVRIALARAAPPPAA